MLEKYKHISFDLDGTLVHTLPEYRHKMVPLAVQELGGKISNPHAIDRFWFEANRDEIIAKEFGLDPETFWKRFHTIDTHELRSAHTFAYDDAEQTLKRLKEMGKTVTIITGAPHNIAEMEIAKLNNPKHDYYLSTTSHPSQFNSKPDPAAMLFVLGEIGSTPEETLYIGNSNEDAYFAKNAEADFVYLERKEHEFDLRDYALRTIHTLDQLFD